MSAVVGIGDHLGRQLPVSLLVPVSVASVDTTLESQLTECCTRVDTVWDTYHISCLKSQTRINRCETAGRRTKVSPQIPLPKRSEWQRFLNDSTDNDALFKFLSDELHRNTSEARYLLLTTKAESVLSNRHTDITNLALCQHEEADTRVMLHLNNAAQNGHRKAYIRTVDTDVVVLAMDYFNQLCTTALWVGLGTGKHFREIPIHVICEQLGPCRCQSLLLFHAFTGCNVTSCLELEIRQHGMHGFHIHTSQTLSLPYWKTPKLSISTQAIWNTWNVSQY